MSQNLDGRRLVGILAHPDDEMGFASVLAHYARRGVSVRLVSLTSGQKGFRDHNDIRGTDELVRVRREEFRSASRVLGLEPPTVLEFVDQELLGPEQDAIRQRLTGVLAELQPDVVVTFGPDGVTGHPDHRAVSCFVTEILQSREEGPTRLYYHALNLRTTATFAEQMGRTLLGVAERYLTTRIRVSEEEVETAVRAVGEYRSQFSPESMNRLRDVFRKTIGEVYFRRALPPGTGTGSLEDTLFPD